MEDFSRLLKELEPLVHDEAVLIAAFQAEKLVDHGSDATGAQLLKALGAKGYSASAPKQRVIAFSVKRSLTDRGFRAALHVCGRQDEARLDSPLEIRKTYPLKCLYAMRVQGPGAGKGTKGGGPPSMRPSLRASDTDLPSLGAAGAAGGAGGAPLLELSFGQHHGMPEHRGQYVVGDLEQAMFVMSLAQDAVLPSVGGVSLDRVDAWWSSHRDLVAAALPPFAGEVVTPGTVQARARAHALARADPFFGVGRRDAAGVLVSAKEEADLEDLLGMFALGLGEPEQFAACLQDEHAALEAANVYGLLESGPLVEGVLGQLRRTQGILDDLDESLKVFDFKLRHMRDDIAAIEASNNTLERQNRHNAALLEALDRLLRNLALDPQVAATLENASLEPSRLRSTISAAWALHDQQRRLAPGGGPGSVSPLVANMRAVRDARAQLDALAQRFLGRAAQHLASTITQLTGEALNDGSGGGVGAERAARLAAPGRARLREALPRCRELLAVAAALDGATLARLQMHYAQAVNALLRRELRGCSSELRRAAQADAAAGGGGELGFTARDRGAFGSGRRTVRLSSNSAASEGSEDAAAASPRRRGGGAPGGAAARVAAYASGAAPGVPLHAAWAHLLGTYLPFLLEEAEFAADLFYMHRSDDPRAARGGDAPPPPPRGGGELTGSGAAALDSLLGGLEGDFMGLVDMTARSGQARGAMAVPMLSTTRAWLSRLDGHAAAAPLAATLSAAEGRLAANWAAFVAAQAGAVDSYDGRSKMGLQAGIKNMHLLPFVGQFVGMAAEVEALLADAIADASAGAGASPPRGGGGERRLPPQRQPGASGGGGGEEGEEGRLEEEVALHAAGSARAEADSAYQSLTGRIFACLERQAAGDAKYADRLRLENYGHFADELAPLASRCAVIYILKLLLYTWRWEPRPTPSVPPPSPPPFPSAPALRESVHQAEARRDSAVAQYIRDQLEWGKMWKLLEFGEKLEKLLQVVSPPEVAFQKDCSAGEVRSLIKSTMEGADKKLDALCGRVRKHLGATPLADAMWARLKSDLLTRYERLEGLMERCYPNMPLRPSPEELRELFKLAGAG
ncbi:MAG: exocyst complex component Sec3-domain-containing protein [Monoraphidium minutum]|nr:MAG: exocyst complex component Sec3-domain-containing protein [Monoraphidium minutum]